MNMHETNEIRQSCNHTGTMFYTRLSDRPGAFRVRFKSYHGGFENQQKQTQLQQLYNNYTLFKHGKPRLRIKTSMQLNRQSSKQKQKTFNLKDRLRENQNLKSRLNDMKMGRRKILDTMRDIKPI